MSRKKLKTVQKILMAKKLRETTYLCVEIMNSGLNFIRLLRVVITPSERRKRLETTRKGETWSRGTNSRSQLA